MKSFLIIGLGRFGDALARELFRLGHEVMAVDKDEESVNKIADFVTHSLVADVRDENVLRSIGARNFDHAIVAFSDNIQDNILITLMLKEIGVKNVISKGRNSLHVKVLKKIGADRIVFPETDMGVRLAQTLSSSNIIDFIEISDNYSIIETNTPKKWIGNSIKKLDVRAKYGINILAIKGQDGRTVSITPSPEYVIKPGDILVIVGANDDIQNID